MVIFVLERNKLFAGVLVAAVILVGVWRSFAQKSEISIKGAVAWRPVVASVSGHRKI